jgi:MarR family transcriptional regulator for hemolysin
MNDTGNLEDILFYSLEKSIKRYRQFAQQQLVKNGFDITIDQWLLLKTLHDHPEQTQNQIAQKIFKDYASVTRIIDLLVLKQYLTRIIHPADRRRSKLSLTESALKLLEEMRPIIDNNRKIALRNISKEQLDQCQQVLDVIFNNCKA